MNKIIGREFKHAVHIPAVDNYREDTHMVKELLHYEDGDKRVNLRLIENFKRPFYVTKEHYRNHNQKKEFEYLNRVNEFTSTQSNLANSIASKIGKVGYRKNILRDVVDSPFIYGVDIRSTSVLKRMYMERFPDLSTESTVAALDIENDIDTGIISMITIVMFNKMFTVVTKDFLKGIDDPLKKIDDLYNKHVPDTDIVRNCRNINTKIVENELELVIEIMKVAHEWKPDFLAIWNINYDLPKMTAVLEKYGVDPKNVYSDPSIPKELRVFRYKEGQKQRVTESGRVMAISPQDQWHFCYCTSSFIWIDAMAAYSYVRVGQAAVPGGYGLDNILKHNGIEGKLKFDDQVKYKGADWHRYMVKNKPLEYVVYNKYDTLGMLELEAKTKDLQTSMPILSGISDYDVFNSGPKKIVDGLHFFYLENKRVIGTKPSRVNDNKILGLDKWIVTLPSYRLEDNGMKCLKDSDVRTAIRTNVFDLDSISAYPSAGVACNISKQTTKKEIISIEGMTKDEFMYDNINLSSGGINAIEYCSNMFNFKTIPEIDDTLREMGLIA